MQISHLGNGQRVLVLGVRFNDYPTPRLARPSEWAALLNDQVNEHYDKFTYGQTTFTFEAPYDQWVALDENYNTSFAPWGRWAQQALWEAEPHIDLRPYHRLVCITTADVRRGEAFQGSAWPFVLRDPVHSLLAGEWFGPDPYEPLRYPLVGFRAMTVSTSNEEKVGDISTFDGGAFTVAHELGHQLGVPTHYGPVPQPDGTSREGVGLWDIMGDGVSHFLAWAKADRSWMPTARITTVGPPPPATSLDEIVRLQPQEITGATGTQLIRVPFNGASPFAGYAIENRQPIEGDELIPEAGVLITRIDASRMPGLNTVVEDDPGEPGIPDAPLGVGGEFLDPLRGISISVVGQVGRDYDVRIRITRPSAPDLVITPWGAPPWETTDIWIDSEITPWGTYRYHDAAGNPVGQGDPVWLGHTNRIHARIRNVGGEDANDVRVRVSTNQPPGLGDAGPHWDERGVIEFPVVPGDGTPVDGYVTWQPTVGAHTCIRAVIDGVDDELTFSNNRAQENVTIFETSTGSPWEKVSVTMTVYNPFPDEKAAIHILPSSIPRGWVVDLKPSQVTLDPGDVAKVRCTVDPNNPPKYPNPKNPNKAGFIGRPRLTAFALHHDAWMPIGGVDLRVHLVERTTLALHAKRDLKELVATGVLEPAKPGGTMAGQIIAIEVTLMDGSSQIRHVTTNAKGWYQLRIPQPEGIAMVQAFYGGDTTHRSSESEPVKTLM